MINSRQPWLENREMTDRAWMRDDMAFGGFSICYRRSHFRSMAHRKHGKSTDFYRIYILRDDTQNVVFVFHIFRFYYFSVIYPTLCRTGYRIGYKIIITHKTHKARINLGIESLWTKIIVTSNFITSNVNISQYFLPTLPSLFHE